MRCLLFAIGILLVAIVPSTRAESLYRCVGRSGAVSYQSQACSETQRLDRIVEYRADPIPSRDSRQPRFETRRQPSRLAIRNPRQRVAHGSVAVTSNSRCRASKAKREADLRRLGLSRTYEQLSRLDAPVREACRGF
ncbi:hypothetical protein H9L17_01070 [Thermomonas brevis]|uniref:DUF4124 domain-containing protein n=1 Tax=Thermomonas brevis TaxID=215691 RepID=A0A7G9QTY1_9GAMM|nr:hypothetical protein [Thermomonas brevis]QNN46806.1 hypothetical protein H9L17_01070 [Thermomonas brevis]